jgi:hypothetical protein
MCWSLTAAPWLDAVACRHRAIPSGSVLKSLQTVQGWRSASVTSYQQIAAIKPTGAAQSVRKKATACHLDCRCRLRVKVIASRRVDPFAHQPVIRAIEFNILAPIDFIAAFAQIRQLHGL